MTNLDPTSTSEITDRDGSAFFTGDLLPALEEVIRERGDVRLVYENGCFFAESSEVTQGIAEIGSGKSAEEALRFLIGAYID